MLNIRIKRYLNDIIDVAYPDATDNELRLYKGFCIYVTPQEKRRSAGVYYPDERKIELYNARLGINSMLKCSLHELSHHLDYCINGETGHRKPFYNEYRKLIYASMDMGIFTADVFDDNWSSDQNKVRKIVSEYKPNPVEYNPSFPPIIKVYNAYSIKEDLKTKKYTWNTIEQFWEKETTNIIEETQFLEQLKCLKSDTEDITIKRPYYVIEDSSFIIVPVVYIEAIGDTYTYRETLKQYGFFFKEKGKKWIKKVNVKNYDREIDNLYSVEELQDIKFEALKNRK